MPNSEIRVYRLVNGVEKLIRIEKASNANKSRKQKYREFLKSKNWKNIRERKIRKSKNRCCVCKATENLHAHHLFYRKSWTQTRTSDLRWLCEMCHAMCHESIKMGLLPKAPKSRNWRDINKYFIEMLSAIQDMHKIKIADEQMARMDEEVRQISGVGY